MFENRRFINREEGIFISLVLSTAVYFVPALLYRLLSPKIWIYSTYSFFAILFCAYILIPLIYSRVKFSFQINFFRVNNYSVGIFLAGFLYFWLIEHILRTNGLADSRNSIFSYLDSMGRLIEKGAGISRQDRFINESGMFLSILLPIAEEMFFRCYLQETIKRYFSVLFAITAPALCVTLRHLSLFMISGAPVNFSAISVMAAAFVSFCIFGYVYEKEDNVFSSMIVHFMGNISFGVCFFIFS